MNLQILLTATSALGTMMSWIQLDTSQIFFAPLYE